MSQIGSKNTKPEMRVRKLTHSLGYRYRLHRKDLPGCPDMVFPSRKKVIFVHGCFWHGHRCRHGRVKPKTRAEFWRDKIDTNKKRDRKCVSLLKKLGWGVLIVWECELKPIERLEARIVDFLEKTL